jgi:replicative DNA helicase
MAVAHMAVNKPRESEPTHARALPHSLELERAVLAPLLSGLSATAMQTVRATIPHPIAFFHRDHRMVYLACLELDDSGHRVDAQAVIELLQRYPFQAMIERLRQQQLLFDSDQLDALDRRRLREFYRRAADEKSEHIADSVLSALGNAKVILDIMEAHGPTGGLARNVLLLWDAYLKRRLILRLQGLADKAYLTTDEFPRLLDEGNQIILELNRHNRVASIHAIADVVEQTLHRITEQNESPESAVKTGFEDLDKLLVSLRPGGLYVLAARPGVGKTSMALKMVANIAGAEDAAASHGVLFFSLEVDRVDLLKKLLSAESNVEFSKLDSGHINAEEMALVEAAGAKCRSWKLHLMDVADLTVHALRSAVKRHQLESGNALKLVVLDYLQLLRTTKHDATEYERISEISRILKLMAMELKIPVLALSQMSREGDKGVSSQPRDPRLSDLRGSGSIEQDADAVVFMHRVDGADGSEDEVRRLKVMVAKNRFGRTGWMPVDFYPGRLQFIKAVREDEAEGDDGFNRAQASRQKRRRHGERPSDDEHQFDLGPAPAEPAGEGPF